MGSSKIKDVSEASSKKAIVGHVLCAFSLGFKNIIVKGSLTDLLEKPSVLLRSRKESNDPIVAFACFQSIST